MAVAAAQEPVSADVVGNAFVQQYYHILHHSPPLVHRFYQDVSKLGRPEHDGAMTVTTTLEKINSKIVSLDYDNFRAEIKSVDSQASFNSGVHVLVTGFLTGKDDNATRNFAQSFFLAPQEGGGYFVLNDLFRYVENPTSVDENKGTAVDTVETNREIEVLPVEENHVTEETTITVEEPKVEEVHAVTNGEVTVDPVVVEQEPVAKVVEEVKKAAPVVVDIPVKTDAPKKTYASIVMDLKGSNVPFTNPARTLRKIVQKSQEPPVKVAPVATSAAEVSVSNSRSAENLNNEEAEADGFSVYIKGLPSNAQASQLEEEFKKYGAIKSGGIQVRSNRQQGFCFGFVEYEELSSVQKAIEASPVTIGTKQAVVEEKRSTNSRSANNNNNNNNNRGRFTNGRGYGGFRNEGNRGGRGANEGAPRGFNRGEFNGNRSSEFGNNRGNNKGRSDGYQRADSNGGGRVNRGSGMANGIAKNMPAQQTAAA